TVGRSTVSGGSDNALPLGGCLFQNAVKRCVVVRSEVSLAISITDTNNRGDQCIDCVVDGVPNAVVGVVAHVDEINRGAGADAARILHIDVGFGFVARADGWASGTRNQYQGWILDGQSGCFLKIFHVRQENLRLPYHGDRLARPSVARVISCSYVINGGDVLGREKILSGLVGRET